MPSMIFMGLLSLLELVWLIAAVVIVLMGRRLPSGEAFVLAVAFVYAGLSGLYQVAFLIGAPAVAIAVEVIALVVLTRAASVHRSSVAVLRGELTLHWQQSPWSVSLLSLSAGYLAIQALMLPEGHWDCMRYNLTRVLLFQQESSVLLREVTEFHQAVFPVGGDILRHLFLRWGTDYGIAVFNFLAYIAVVAGVHGVLRRVTTPRRAFTGQLLVASMPMLVYQATGTKPDLIAVAVMVASVIAGERWRREQDPRWLPVLLVMLSFGVSVKTTFLAFAVPYLLLLVGSLWMRDGFAAFRSASSMRPVSWFWIIALTALFSQGWLFAHNKSEWGGIWGPPAFVDSHRNGDGVNGGIANAVRYGCQAIHLPEAVDVLTKRLMGFELSGHLTNAYRSWAEPVFGGRGARYPFRVDWSDNESGAWYGPLVIVAFVVALARPKRWRSEEPIRWGLTALSCFAIVCGSIAWMPWNARFLGPVFVLGVMAVTPMLPGVGHRVWRVAAISVLLYAIVVNTDKPLVHRTKSPGTWSVAPSLSHNIWKETAGGTSRDTYTDRIFGEHRVDEVLSLIPHGRTVLVTASGPGWLYPFMAKRPDVRFLPRLWKSWSSQAVVPPEADHVLCLGGECAGLQPGAMRLDVRVNDGKTGAAMISLWSRVPVTASARGTRARPRGGA